MNNIEHDCDGDIQLNPGPPMTGQDERGMYYFLNGVCSCGTPVLELYRQQPVVEA